MKRQAIFPHRLVAAFSCHVLFLNEILTFSLSKERDRIRVPYINNATVKLKARILTYTGNKYMYTRAAACGDPLSSLWRSIFPRSPSQKRDIDSSAKRGLQHRKEVTRRMYDESMQ